MGTNTCDYDFDEARKPCGTGEGDVAPSGQCIENAKRDCRWFPMCDLSGKIPWEKPTQPKKYIKPKRRPLAKVYLQGSQFFEKQDKIKRQRNKK